MAMMDEMRKADGKTGGRAADDGQKAMPSHANAQMQMMQKRMDMMETMMQTMMDQQGMMSGPEPDATPRSSRRSSCALCVGCWSAAARTCVV